ncbi:hypothetical protein FXO37_03645 [Capsicum annuum]|nr:hypothetical protein FXO37_03645 [Capsicum annuum]
MKKLLSSLHSIYLKENITNPPKEGNHELLKLQPNHYLHKSPSTGSSTNLLVGNMPIQQNCTSELGMGREASHNSHSGPSISCPVGHGKPEPRTKDIWLQFMDSHPILGDQLTIPEGDGYRITGQHHELV